MFFYTKKHIFSKSLISLAEKDVDKNEKNKIRVIDKILITYAINPKIIIKNSKVNKNLI